MESYQIIFGFSEIRSELWTKTKEEGTLVGLRLWFNLEDNILYVHNYHKHEKSLVLAIFSEDSGKWSITFRGGVFGARVIHWALESVGMREISEFLNSRYGLYGYIAFR